MNHYINIHIKHTRNSKLPVSLSKVYSKVHERLADLKSTTLGISFPRYSVTLGDTIRLHGGEEELRRFKEASPLLDEELCRISDIKNIPAKCQYRRVSRKQSNMSKAKLRRLQKRGTIGEDKLKAYKIKMLQQGLDDPYVDLISKTNKQRYRRYFKFGPLTDTATEGKFDTFGLSKKASVPWF